MMRNTELAKLDGLVGEWTTTMSDAWFLEPKGIEVHDTTTIEWLGESFLLGRSDANAQFIALYHDDRGVCRQFAMTFGDGHWTMTREDPDFHQRFVAEVGKNRISGHWEASEDRGKTWRKDFDLTFERA